MYRRYLVSLPISRVRSVFGFNWSSEGYCNQIYHRQFCCRWLCFGRYVSVSVCVQDNSTFLDQLRWNSACWLYCFSLEITSGSRWKGFAKVCNYLTLGDVMAWRPNLAEQCFRMRWSFLVSLTKSMAWRVSLTIMISDSIDDLTGPDNEWVKIIVCFLDVTSQEDHEMCLMLQRVTLR